MDFLGSLLIGKPLHILAVAVLFVVLYFVWPHIKPGNLAHRRWLLVAAVAWAAYATWEWLILVRTPEANIRVDLLLIYPVLLILSAWAIYRSLRQS
jgi:hypothetical protein